MPVLAKSGVEVTDNVDSAPSCLDKDLLAIILSQVGDAITLCQRQVPAVCRHFQSATLEPLCWQHLSLSPSNTLPSFAVNDDVVRRLARTHGPKLLTVCLDGARLLGPSAVSTLAHHCGQLQSFTAVGCVGISFGAVRFLCKSCPSLHTLRVSGCHLDADPVPQAEADKLARTVVANCPQLRVLSLSHLRLEASLEALLCCPVLEALDLSSCEHLPCTEHFTSLFAPAEQRLTSLKLGGCTRLQSLSGQFTQLRTLYLGGCERLNDAEGLGLILQHCCKTLTLLSLVGCQNLSAEGLQTAFGHAGMLEVLETLVLGGCRVHDELCELLGPACPSLTSLDLWDCPMTNAGVAAIIKGGAPLSELNLRECRMVTGQVLQELCASPTARLRTLDVSCLGPLADEDLVPVVQTFAEHLRCLICGGSRCCITDKLLEELPRNMEALHLEECRLLSSVAPIARLQNLTALSLENVEDPAAASKLLDICQCCAVSSLNISGCAIGDDIVSRITASLPRLLELEVCSTPITDAGLRDIVRHCARLLHLGMLNCPFVSSAAVQECRQILPACVVSFLEN
ncbi:Fbxl20 [Symbiodinium pilosum]|uniref:Fbxl20 protein n=1 Tax=Symbiodinium pilosum TaxID=2952 RepID=A0A812WRT6_SYMPI|nr:Fbxl20 [Symbiodinium pilosum]